MSGALKKIAETTVTSNVASVTLTGIDTTYNVYMVRYFNVQPATDAQKLEVRFTVSGSPDTSSNYDRVLKVLDIGGGFTAQGNDNQDSVDGLDQGGTQPGEVLSGVMYLFNFPNVSEHSFITFEGSAISSASQLNARQGAAMLTVDQANDGVNYFFASGDIATGTFALYGLSK